MTKTTSTKKKLTRLALLAAACGTGWVAAGAMMAARPAHAQEAAVMGEPATRPAAFVLPADVVALLKEVDAAYAAAAPLALEGTVTIDIDVADMKQNQTLRFKSAYQDPTHLRHEAADELVAVADGEQAHLLNVKGKQFLSTPLAKEAPRADQLPPTFGSIVAQQNPALMVAAAGDVAKVMLPEGLVTSAKKVEGVQHAGKSYTSVDFAFEEGVDFRLLIDPQTKLFGAVLLDMSRNAVAQGATDVKKATVAIDYTSTQAKATPAEGAFVFAPPADAKDAKSARPDPMGQADPAAALEGKPAPDFALKDPDGKEVKLADLKGSVVVLDFWATWCGPCRAGLPHLDKLYQAEKAGGLKAYAVNVEEEADTVKKFVESTKLGVPVLMDTDSGVAKKYNVSGIPQTVVVGKDGVVKKVIVGFDPSNPGGLDEAVKAAMK